MDNKIVESAEMLKLARQLIQQGKVDEALGHCNLILKNDHNNVLAWLQVAKIYEAKKNLDRALSCYRKILDIKPNDDKSYINVAIILRQQGKTTEAIQAYQQAIKLNPKQSFRVYENLGEALSNQGQVEQAIVAYHQAVQINPANRKTCNDLAKLVTQLSKASYTLFRKKLFDNKTSDLPAEFYLYFGKFLERQELWEEAIFAYQQVLGMNPKISQEVYPNLGNSYLRAGLVEQAVITYRKAIDLNESSELIHRKMVKDFIHSGRFNGNYCLVNRKHKIIYCSIPKNAHTLFKTMMFENGDNQDVHSKLHKSIHDIFNENSANYSLRNYSDLDNDEYFKFVIIRNPFNRLVSGYLDKFVKRHKKYVKKSYGKEDLFKHHPLRKEIEDVYKHIGTEPDFRKSINFQQFVHYLNRNPDSKLNLHWRPQYTFCGFGLVEFDFVGQFEKLDSVIKYLENKFNFKVRTNVTNKEHKTNYSIY